MRRRRAEVRQLQPDLVYGDVVVSAFINKMMRDGKKNLAARIFYEACRIIQEKTGQEPLKVFKQAVDNVKPRMEVRSRRVGGANYQVPMEVSPRRQQSLALRWLVQAANARSERGAAVRIAHELMDAAEGKRRAYEAARREWLRRILTTALGLGEAKCGGRGSWGSAGRTVPCSERGPGRRPRGRPSCGP